MVEHLSYSSIDLYLSCPEAWRRKYIAKEKTTASPALAFGSAWHGTLERMISAPGTNAIETWREEWTKATQQEICWGVDTPEQHHNEGVRLLSNPDVQAVIQSIKPKRDIAGAMVERKIELLVPGVGIPVIGYIDIILEDGTPADIKTSARSWSDDKATNSLQSLFYLAAMNQAGMDVRDWTFKHFVFVKTKTPQVQILENKHSPGQMFFLFNMIKHVWQAIRKEVLYVNPTGWRCSPSYCDFWANCRGKV